MRVSTAIVTDAQSGRILYADRADERRAPASMTKMMTAYLFFEAVKTKGFSLNAALTISPNAASKGGSTLELRPGDTISAQDALCCMLVKSANDAATVLGEALAASEAEAAALLNAQAKALGMHHTHFTNMSGLHDDNLFSTAFDMALLARALILDFPEFYHFFGLKTYRYRGETYENYNTLLGLKGVDGLKTGNTDAAGFNLAVSAAHQDNRIIAVVMNTATAEQRHDAMLHLIDRGFQALDLIL